MKEYRVVAYFDRNWSPKVYKRKVVYTLEEGMALLEEAKQVHAEKYHYNYLNRIVLESRNVEPWEVELEDAVHSDTLKGVELDG